MSDEPRVPPLEPTELTDDQRVVVEPLMNEGELLNIFATLAHHPKLLKRWLVFGNHVMLQSTLPPRDRELLILRTGWRCGSDYEFGQHTIIGTAVGLDDRDIERVTLGTIDDAWSPHEARLLRAADELVADHRISDATWDGLGEQYSTQQLLDVVFTVGQYTLVSSALNTLGVQREEGVPGFPDRAE